MGSKFFINRKLFNKLKHDLKKRTEIEYKISQYQEKLSHHQAKVEKDVDDFTKKVDEGMISNIFHYIENKGNTKQKKQLEELRQRYTESNLFLEDPFSLKDWYEEMLDNSNEKDIED